MRCEGWADVKNSLLPQPNQQHKTKQNTSSNLGSLFLVCNLILTHLEEIWKTTSIFLKITTQPTTQNKTTCCHNQPTTQNKTKQIVWCCIIIGEKTTTTTTPPRM
jgi:hypothetical protein